MAEHSEQLERPNLLDRPIDLTVISWAAIGWVVVLATAIGLRVFNLDVWALSPDEAHRAFDSWSLYRGQASDPGRDIPNTSPVITLLVSFAFFLFGATDATARIAPALLGVGLVFLLGGLRAYTGRSAALGMAALAAFSPTLVYASRVVDSSIAIAFGAVLLLVAFLHVGTEDRSQSSRLRWSLTCGIALGIMFASGPASITVMISLFIGGILALVFDRTGDGAVRRSMQALTATSGGLLLAVNGLIVTLILLFSRFLSDLNALRGIGETFGDWARLMTTATSTTEVQYFVLTLLVYEILAVIFAAVTISRPTTNEPGELTWPFFAGWFAASLLLISFSSGRAPEHAALVALPLVLLAGIGLGQVVAAINLSELVYGRGAMLFIAMFGFVISAAGFVVLAGRVDTAPDRTEAIIEALIVGTLVVIPLAVACVALTRQELALEHRRLPIYIGLMVVALFVGAYTLRSTLLLNFYNADEGVEMLAPETSTAAVRPLVDSLIRLSRDMTVTETSARNPEGGEGLSVAIDSRVEWPYRWYFREFPDADVVESGQTTTSGAQIVIAPDETGMQEAGYTPRDYNTLNRAPGSYSGWVTSRDYILYREPPTPTAPDTVSVGLNGELTAKVFPNSGPYSLFERTGAGSGRGQFSAPRGITTSAIDGSVYVVDSGNSRVERFDATGAFVGIFGDESGTVSFSQADAGGPTGITTGPDGLIYVADTWGHRIVVIDESGREVRSFGTFGDIGDSPDPNVQPEVFFGPRDVAIFNDEMYIVDTGNERVVVLGLDGAFHRAFGGRGSEPGQLVEPVGIAIDQSGLIYVADANNGRISVFSSDGSPQAQWPVDTWLGRTFFEPYLAIGPDGNIYATSSATGSVEVFSPDGQLLESITEVNGEALVQPYGITSTADGAVLITDGGKNAVFRYVPVQQLPPPDEQPVDEEPASPEGTPVASPAGGNQFG